MHQSLGFWTHKLPEVITRYTLLFSFPLLCRMPEINSLKEERFVLTHGFRVFNPWSLGSIVSGLLVR
jgi:hypothetical protein